MVDRRSGWAEACLKRCVDRLGMKILAVVGTEYCENQYRRKGKGSLTMQISQGVIDPNPSPNRRQGKGKQVNIPALLRYVW